MPTETPINASPDAARESAERTRDFLTQLRAQVQPIVDPETRKTFIRDRLKTLKHEEIDDLKRQMDGNLIPQDLLDSLVDLRELVDAQKDALRQQIESSNTAPEQKPEGWTDWAGNKVRGGAQKVEEWTDWLWGKTKSGFGTGWDKTVEGFSAVGEWIMKIWGKVEASFNKARAGIAVALGGLVAKMEKILPAWLKDGFNTIVGNYGVFYATLNRLGVKVTEGAQQLVQGAREQANASVDHFSEIYEQAKAWGNTTLDFPGFIREVASRLRKMQPSLTFTMADMVAMAGIVAGEKKVEPAAPGVAPTTAVAGVATTATPQASPSAAPVPEQLTRREVQSLTVNSVAVSKVEENGKTLLKVGDRKFSVNVTFPVTLKKLEEVSDGSIALTGAMFGFSSTVIISKQEFESIIAALRDATDNKKIKVNYTNSKNEKKEQEVAFEIVTP